MKRIHARFNEEGIEINYPVRKLVSPQSGRGFVAAGSPRSRWTPRGLEYAVG